MSASKPGSRDKIAEALFGSTKRRVLALLFGRPEQSFYLREIARETAAGLGAVQRELAQLVGAGLIDRSPRGNQVLFSANRDSPVYEELRSLLAKTAGIADVLRAALASVAARIDIGFLYGSIPRGEHTSASDVDLMLIGDLQLADVLPVLHAAEEQLGREVNATIYDRVEFADKFRRREHFIRRVVERPRIMLIGSNDDLKELVGESVARRA